MLYTPDFIKTPQIIDYRIVVGDDGVDTVLSAITKIKYNFAAIELAINALENLNISPIVIDLGTL
jgi:hypothetical protein